MKGIVTTLLQISLFLSLGSFSIFFALNNAQWVALVLPGMAINLHMPIFLAVLGSLLIGMLLGVLLCSFYAFPKLYHLKKTIRQHRRAEDAYRQEATALRLEAQAKHSA